MNTHPAPTHPTPTPGVPVHLRVGGTGVPLGELATDGDHFRADLAAFLRAVADLIEHGPNDDQVEDVEP